ncbi:hypothetical protein J2X56_001805 [Herbaspirillum sp. 1173]|uniref:hypothetical protein n=1 Tax=Herbaspirillum sp. 1173 TaxID=2817734 RepID=UPI0028673E05|nr:hypothetical protein [Herbaspirillum sp. 1173]MDR6739791.1 hypothetical protein [Herbaspirillum sp. 1173]
MNKKLNEFDNFIDSLVDELMAMSDDEVLDGENPEAVRSEGLRLLSAAKIQVGKARLAAARSGVAASRAPLASVYAAVSVSEARKFLANARNDSRYTFAARNLGELTDDEVLSLYAKLKSLEGKNSEGHN